MGKKINLDEVAALVAIARANGVTKMRVGDVDLELSPYFSGAEGRASEAKREPDDEMTARARKLFPGVS